MIKMNKERAKMIQDEKKKMYSLKRYDTKKDEEQMVT